MNEILDTTIPAADPVAPETPAVSSIYGKLAAIQNEIRSRKAQRNDFAGFNYRSLEDILALAKPVALKHHAVITLSDEIVIIGGTPYMRSTATLTSTDEDRESISTHAYTQITQTKKGMSIEQMFGAASSYCRKYCTAGLIAASDSDDPDSTQQSRAEEETRQEALQTLQELINRTGIPGYGDKIAAHYGVRSIDDLGVSALQDGISQMCAYFARQEQQQEQ